MGVVAILVVLTLKARRRRRYVSSNLYVNGHSVKLGVKNTAIKSKTLVKT